VPIPDPRSIAQITFRQIPVTPARFHGRYESFQTILQPVARRASEACCNNHESLYDRRRMKMVNNMSREHDPGGRGGEGRGGEEEG